jgi:hypothetical protein
VACPACQEAESDKSGDHLCVFLSGKFACAVHSGDRAHNRRIVELMPELGKPSDLSRKLVKRPKPCRRITEATSFVIAYPYQDASGRHVYDVRRYEPKDFRSYNVATGKLGLDGATRVLYRLPEVLKAETVWIVEGEKDADGLAAIGMAATTNTGGALKWEDSYTECLAGKDILLCGDSDAMAKNRSTSTTSRRR